MPLPHPRAPARPWRRLVLAVLLLSLFAAAYGSALQALERRGAGQEPASRPPPALDRHTPRVG